MESQKLEQPSVPDDPAWESSKKFLDEHQHCHPHTEAVSECFRCKWRYFRNVSIERIAALTAQVATLEQQLRAMTEDRDLWQDAHNDDCPNKARADAAEQQLAALKASHAELITLLQEVRQAWPLQSLIRGNPVAEKWAANVDAALQRAKAVTP